MALATIKDSIMRKVTTLEIEDFPNKFHALDRRTNCMVGVHLDDGKVTVLMEKDDAIPLDTAYGRMTTSGYPMHLRVHHAEMGSKTLLVTKRSPLADGTKVVGYETRNTTPAELAKAIMLIVAVLNKAAQLYVAA